MKSLGVLITGAGGGIGRELCQKFKQNGYFVIGTDFGQSELFSCGEIIDFDLGLLSGSAENLREFRSIVLEKLQGRKLKALINNAAVQILGSTKKN